MKKLLLAVGISLGLTANTHAFVIDTEACAGTEYIYDQQGVLVEYDPAVHTFITAETPVFYGAYESIPHMFLAGNRLTQIFVHNTSGSHINFFHRPTFHSLQNGYKQVINAVSDLDGIFSNSNDPHNLQGADMPAYTLGRITVDQNSNNQFFGSASIYWDTSICLAEPPLQTSIESVYSVTGSNARGGISVFLINNGENW